ncbi:NADH dehydrogenase (ubiquinone) complex I, assembly factor 6 [Plutella xylostella]|uniref:NADH dehydrogenase (ubiquinone) complex I, assembly factor 6 n=1 Tax=Plutella xylostella TaxID=51655 RepID=UPI002032478D|nr:NADH dehydrogenase (ubiquinone) complex I, assembly factor 6 [Plutella xylostella]
MFQVNRFKMSLFIRRSLATLSKEPNPNSLDYCSNIVRQYDYENFLSTLLLTKAVRSPALVVRAFNVEIARVQDTTSDPQIAAMRLQFWYDTVGTIYKKEQQVRNVPANPVAQELFKVCSSYKLPRRYLERLVMARNNLLKTKYFQTLEDVEKYAEETVSSIYYLLLSIAGVADVHADHAVSHLGKAQGIVNLLRSTQVASHHKMVSLPMEILMKYQLSQENVLRGGDSENLRNVTFDVASRANSHLQKARSISVPKTVHQILLPAIAVDNYLKRLEQCNFNIYDKKLKLTSGMLPLNLYINSLFSKY